MLSVGGFSSFLFEATRKGGSTRKKREDLVGSQNRAPPPFSTKAGA